MLTMRSGPSSYGRLRPWWMAMLVLLGAALTVRQLVHAAGAPAIDFVHVWRAAHQLLEGSGAYRDPLFSYPPSAALLVAPLGALSFPTARACMLVVNVIAVMAAVLLVMRQLRGRLDGWAVVAVMATGALDAVASTWANGNINGVLILLEVIALRQFLRGRWTSGGAALGLSLALKPVLLPMLALLVVRRQWRALSVAAGIPVALLAAGCLAIPDVRRYLTVVLPYLLHGAQLPYNDSVVGLGFRLALSSAVVLVLRVALLAVAAAVYLRARIVGSGLDERSALFAETGLALVATLLVSPMSETYYTLFLLPSLLWWGMRGRRAGLLAGAVAIACFGTLRLTGIPGDVHHSVTLLAIRPTLGWLALLCFFGSALMSARARTPVTVDARIARKPTATHPAISYKPVA